MSYGVCTLVRALTHLQLVDGKKIELGKQWQTSTRIQQWVSTGGPSNGYGLGGEGKWVQLISHCEMCDLLWYAPRTTL